MAIAKAQGEFTIHGRVQAISTAGVVSAANLAIEIDGFVVNGVALPISSLDSTKVTTLKDAIEAIHNEEEGIS